MTAATEPPGWLIDKSALVRLGHSRYSKAERADLVVLRQDKDFDLIACLKGCCGAIRMPVPRSLYRPTRRR